MIVDLEVNYSDERWRRFNFRKYIKILLRTDIVLSKIRNRKVALSLLACNDKEIKILNHAYLGKNKITNVLAWPTAQLDEFYEKEKRVKKIKNKKFLGDIAISFDYCLKEAKIYKRSFDKHCCHLLVHAVLHLIGYDHISGNDASKMQKIENRILRKMQMQIFQKNI